MLKISLAVLELAVKYAGEGGSWWDSVKATGADLLTRPGVKNIPIVGDALHESASQGVTNAAVDSINKDTVMSSLSDASKKMFPGPEATKKVVGGMATSAINGSPMPPVSTLTGNPSDNDQNSPASKLKDGMGEEISKSFGPAVAQSGKLNNVVGLGMNMMSGQGNVANFLGNKFESLLGGKKSEAVGDDTFKTLGQNMGKAFTPSSPAMQQAGDNIAGIVNKGVDGAMKQTVGPIGNAMYNLLNGDLGGFFKSFGGDDEKPAASPAAGQTPPTPTPASSQPYSPNQQAPQPGAPNDPTKP